MTFSRSSFLSGFVIALLLTAAWSIGNAAVVADEAGEIITKQKTLNLSFNEENPGGNVDLKKIVEEELDRPAECDADMTVCYIKEVSFDITIKKEWHKYLVTELNNQEFAQTVPHLENPIDQLEKSETVIMQETLARRGLLQYLDGGIVKERGFFGALTWLGLLRLGQIKGVGADDPNFNQLLTDEVNNLLNKMAEHDSYIEDNALPGYEQRTPGEGDSLYELWEKYLYLARLAQGAKPVETGNIPVGAGVDVNIDGFVNVERVTQ